MESHQNSRLVWYVALITLYYVTTHKVYSFQSDSRAGKKQRRRGKKRRRQVSRVHYTSSFSPTWMRLRSGTAEDVDRFARRTVKVTREHNEECRRLLGLMGIPFVVVRVSHVSPYS